MALAAGKAELDSCPYVSPEARAELSDASAPPIRQVTIGTGEYEVKIGGETVMFRHEKTFFNKPGFAVLMTDAMDETEMEKRFSKLAQFQYERVGVTLRAELAALKYTGNREKFLGLVKNACAKPYSLILMASDASVMKEALEIAKAKKPLIYAATDESCEAFGNLAKEYSLPLAVKGNGLEGTATAC